MQVVVGTASELPFSLYLSVGRFRYETFVETMQWNLPEADWNNRLEFDAFDTRDAVYIVGLDDIGTVIACGRLNPTDKPYLLASVFPFLVTGDEMPRSREVWELSRLAIRRGAADTFELSRTIFVRALSAARERNASQVLGVVSVSMERFYRRLGYSLRRLGKVCTVQDEKVIACAIETFAAGPNVLYNDNPVKSRGADGPTSNIVCSGW